jgi:hypothetical protein
MSENGWVFLLLSTDVDVMKAKIVGSATAQRKNVYRALEDIVDWQKGSTGMFPP